MIVLISGKAGAGKSTLKDALLKSLSETGIAAATLRFAQPVYEAHTAAQEALREYGIPVLEKDRRLLQLIGTEWGRETRDQDIWVKALAHKARKLLTPYCIKETLPAKIVKNDIIVVDDCRFPNELNHDYGCPVLKVRLECDEAIRSERLGYPAPTHISETALDDAQFDLYLHTGKLESMVQAVLDCLKAKTTKSKTG